MQTITPDKTWVQLGVVVAAGMILVGLVAYITTIQVKLEYLVEATRPIPAMQTDIAVIKQAIVKDHQTALSR